MFFLCFTYCGKFATRLLKYTLAVRYQCLFLEMPFFNFVINFDIELGLHMKKQLVKSLVWSIALYGAESWTLKQSDMKKIESFELWVWRRMLQVDWKDRKTNVRIRRRVGVSEEEGLLAQLRKRKLSMYGHWKRRSDSLVQMTVEGEVEGKTRPGRRKTGWIDNIRKWTEGGMVVAREKAHKRMPTVLWGLWQYSSSSMR